ncbi:hypothetical protein Agub_g1010 [Astrephomene gubernaculifera]|uniref:Guanylate cyclase domain-containing protein n=1 Tax=Astrephomene gubernaculifera TaxID=47775 RepID=A0AAD3DER4_9CHLO|nr:hypothetical protein Agub_g1010 [Astrephomene gubernaculifera]
MWRACFGRCGDRPHAAQRVVKPIQGEQHLGCVPVCDEGIELAHKRAGGVDHKCSGAELSHARKGAVPTALLVKEGPLRDAFVLQCTPACFTIISLSGRIPVYQNVNSRHWMGDRVHGMLETASEGNAVSAISAAGAAVDPSDSEEDILLLIFKYDPDALERMLGELAGEGDVWKGVVRVPHSLAPPQIPRILAALDTAPAAAPQVPARREPRQLRPPPLPQLSASQQETPGRGAPEPTKPSSPPTHRQQQQQREEGPQQAPAAPCDTSAAANSSAVRGGSASPRALQGRGPGQEAAEGSTRAAGGAAVQGAAVACREEPQGGCCAGPVEPDSLLQASPPLTPRASRRSFRLTALMLSMLGDKKGAEQSSTLPPPPQQKPPARPGQTSSGSKLFIGAVGGRSSSDITAVASGPRGPLAALRRSGSFTHSGKPRPSSLAAAAANRCQLSRPQPSPGVGTESSSCQAATNPAGDSDAGAEDGAGPPPALPNTGCPFFTMSLSGRRSVSSVMPFDVDASEHTAVPKRASSFSVGRAGRRASMPRLQPTRSSCHYEGSALLSVRGQFGAVAAASDAAAGDGGGEQLGLGDAAVGLRAGSRVSAHRVLLARGSSRGVVAAADSLSTGSFAGSNARVLTFAAQLRTAPPAALLLAGVSQSTAATGAGGGCSGGASSVATVVGDCPSGGVAPVSRHAACKYSDTSVTSRRGGGGGGGGGGGAELVVIDMGSGPAPFAGSTSSMQPWPQTVGPFLTATTGAPSTAQLLGTYESLPCGDSSARERHGGGGGGEDSQGSYPFLLHDQACMGSPPGPRNGGSATVLDSWLGRSGASPRGGRRAPIAGGGGSTQPPSPLHPTSAAAPAVAVPRSASASAGHANPHALPGAEAAAYRSHTTADSGSHAGPRRSLSLPRPSSSQLSGSTHLRNSNLGGVAPHALSASNAGGGSSLRPSCGNVESLRGCSRLVHEGPAGLGAGGGAGPCGGGGGGSSRATSASLPPDLLATNSMEQPGVGAAGAVMPPQSAVRPGTAAGASVAGGHVEARAGISVMALRPKLAAAEASGGGGTGGGAGGGTERASEAVGEPTLQLTQVRGSKESEEGEGPPRRVTAAGGGTLERLKCALASLDAADRAERRRELRVERQRERECEEGQEHGQQLEEGEEGGEEEDEDEECWHEIWATRAVDPLSGEDVLVLVQHDVSAKVVAERHLALVMETEHRLLEQLFPRHILQYITEDFVATAAAAAAAGNRAADLLASGATWRPTVRNCKALSTWHPQVTLLFADIKGFTPMCKDVEPCAVMTMLNDLYSRYDKMLDTYGVFKVETIGDCYFVAGGLVDEDEDGMAAVRDGSRVDPLHAHKVFGFAKAMLAAARQVLMPTSGEPVEIRIGIHSGPVVSGVVGTRMPRFCLFGDTVNTTSRMESSGTPGAIHASEAAWQLLREEAAWEATGGIQVKGKGLMQTYVYHPPAPPAPAPSPSASHAPTTSASATPSPLASIAAASASTSGHALSCASAASTATVAADVTAAANTLPTATSLVVLPLAPPAFASVSAADADRPTGTAPAAAGFNTQEAAAEGLSEQQQLTQCPSSPQTLPDSQVVSSQGISTTCADLVAAAEAVAGMGAPGETSAETLPGVSSVAFDVGSAPLELPELQIELMFGSSAGRAPTAVAGGSESVVMGLGSGADYASLQHAVGSRMGAGSGLGSVARSRFEGFASGNGSSGGWSSVAAAAPAATFKLGAMEEVLEEAL